MPFDVSRLFVRKYLPPGAHAEALGMLEKMRAAFAVDVDHVPWMSSSTHAAALQKLRRIKFEVGKPAQWPDHSFPVSDSYFENGLASAVVSS